MELCTGTSSYFTLGRAVRTVFAGRSTFTILFIYIALQSGQSIIIRTNEDIEGITVQRSLS